MSDATPIELARATAISIRGALCELADNPERSAKEIRARLAEIAQAADGLCENLKQLAGGDPPQT